MMDTAIALVLSFLGLGCMVIALLTPDDKPNTLKQRDAEREEQQRQGEMRARRAWYGEPHPLHPEILVAKHHLER